MPGDKLTSDFVAGKYFEAENFSFALKMRDDESSSAVSDEDAKKEDSRSYARWRTLTPGQNKPTPPFQSEPEDFSLNRLIDSSSPILLQHCMDPLCFFDKAVLVKRSRAGTSGVLKGFLRMEFEKVRITSIDWADGDAISETCKFKFASIKITYMKRKPDGTPASSWPCKWEGLHNG